MSLLYKTLAASVVTVAVVAGIFLQKRFRNFRLRRKLTRLRSKTDRLIGGNTTATEEKCAALANKFFDLYETSVYMQKEDQIRIQELNQIRKSKANEINRV